MNKLFLVLFIFLCHSGNAQVKQWQMDTFAKAEKARKWRSGKSSSKLWLSGKKKRKKKKKYKYGQPSKIRHKGYR